MNEAKQVILSHTNKMMGSLISQWDSSNTTKERLSRRERKGFLSVLCEISEGCKTQCCLCVVLRVNYSNVLSVSPGNQLGVLDEILYSLYTQTHTYTVYTDCFKGKLCYMIKSYRRATKWALCWDVLSTAVSKVQANFQSHHLSERSLDDKSLKCSEKNCNLNKFNSTTTRQTASAEEDCVIHLKAQGLLLKGPHGETVLSTASFLQWRLSIL